MAPPGLDGVQNAGFIDDIKDRLSPPLTEQQFKDMKYDGVFPQKGDHSNMPELNRYEYGGRDVPEKMPVVNPVDPRQASEVPRVPFGTPDYPLRELSSGQSTVRYGPPGVRGEGQRQLGERLGMDKKPNFDVGSQPAVQQPQITPEMAKALENAFKDEARIPQGPPPPPEALPVPPVNNLPQGVPGGPQGGLSLAPGGLSSLPTNALMPATAGSQGGSIATAGLMPLPAIENSTYSTPLLDQMATGNSMFGSSSLSPISPTILGGWGWGGGSGFNMGGGGGGFDFGGGGGMVMPEMSFGAGG
jgi:hypothetical protein